MRKENILSKISTFYLFLGIILVTGSIVIFLVPTVPYIAYRINPAETTRELDKLSQEISDDGISAELVNQNTLPPVDPSLPEEPYVVIEKIGVYSPISIDKDYIKALRNGSWMVPEFGTPTNEKTPIIIAAHRFGYTSWSNQKRTKISFYNLPKIGAGDIVEVIWEQRSFKYEIYYGEESNFITDYDADLILYTCKFFNSPVRIFRYANLVENF